MIYVVEVAIVGRTLIYCPDVAQDDDGLIWTTTDTPAYLDARSLVTTEGKTYTFQRIVKEQSQPRIFFSRGTELKIGKNSFASVLSDTEAYLLDQTRVVVPADTMLYNINDPADVKIAGGAELLVTNAEPPSHTFYIQQSVTEEPYLPIYYVLLLLLTMMLQSDRSVCWNLLANLIIIGLSCVCWRYATDTKIAFELIVVASSVLFECILLVPIVEFFSFPLAYLCTSGIIFNVCCHIRQLLPKN